MPHAAAIVGHGGHGTTLGALAHGVPLVVLPLFSGDQWANARAVARAGVGVALDAEGTARPVLAVPAAETLRGLAGAVRRVLDEPAYARRAPSVAETMRALPPVDDALDALAGYRSSTAT